MTVSDGVSCAQMLISDKTFDKIVPDDWHKSFENYSVLTVFSKHIITQKLSDKM